MSKIPRSRLLYMLPELQQNESQSHAGGAEQHGTASRQSALATNADKSEQYTQQPHTAAEPLDDVCLTFDEKQALSQDINDLPQEQVIRVVQIIQDSLPEGMREGGDEVIEIDIDSVDNGTLRELQAYVKECLHKRRGEGETLQ